MQLAQHPPHIPSPCLAWQPPDPKQLVRRTNLAQSHHQHHKNSSFLLLQLPELPAPAVMQELEQGDRAGTDTTNTSIRDITLPLKHAALGLCPTSCEHQGPFHPIWSQFRELNLPKIQLCAQAEEANHYRTQKRRFPKFYDTFQEQNSICKSCSISQSSCRTSPTSFSHGQLQTQCDYTS